MEQFKGFWRWCIILRIIEFLDFIHRPVIVSSNVMIMMMMMVMLDIIIAVSYIKSFHFFPLYSEFSVDNDLYN
jgi:hypothetical protein